MGKGTRMKNKKIMTRKKFGKILKEYGYSDVQIKLLWNSRPFDFLDESALRLTAEYFKDNKDLLK